MYCVVCIVHYKCVFYYTYCKFHLLAGNLSLYTSAFMLCENLDYTFVAPGAYLQYTSVNLTCISMFEVAPIRRYTP